MKFLCRRLLVALVMGSSLFLAISSTQAAPISDADISDAYLYLLGRVLVLRQQRLDFEKEGLKWNEITYREPGGVAWANPNLDVAYSEAWVAVDEQNCVLLEVPKVAGGRYYTWHMLNGWGETVLNINERTFPQHPSGKFALCLKGSTAKVPADALRVDLPSKGSRVLARIELGSDPKEAIRLQHEFKLTPLGNIQSPKVVQVPLFANDKLPGVEIFDTSAEVLASEADINPGMDEVRGKVAAVAALAKGNPEGRKHIDAVIQQQAVPSLEKLLLNPGPKENGWGRPAVFGNYGSDYRMRTMINLAGIWANNRQEAVYFGNFGLDGSRTFTQTFPVNALPNSKAGYFWSVIAVDAVEYKVIPNPKNRFLLNKQSKLQYNPDGSLTLSYGPKLPPGTPEGNWLPTPEGSKYNLTFRFYGPTKDVSAAKYFPPPLVEKN